MFSLFFLLPVLLGVAAHPAAPPGPFPPSQYHRHHRFHHHSGTGSVDWDYKSQTYPTSALGKAVGTAAIVPKTSTEPCTKTSTSSVSVIRSYSEQEQSYHSTAASWTSSPRPSALSKSANSTRLLSSTPTISLTATNSSSKSKAASTTLLPATKYSSKSEGVSTTHLLQATTSSSKLETVSTTKTTISAATAPTNIGSYGSQINLQQFGLLQANGDTIYNNVKITWPAMSGAASYDVLRGASANADDLTVIANAPATLVDDYDIPFWNETVYYSVRALSSNKATLQQSVIGSIVLSPAPLPEYVTTISNYYNNTVFSPTVSPQKRAAEKSSHFAIESDPDNDKNPMIVQFTTYTDGTSSNKTVLSSETLCAPANGTCRIESQGFHYNGATGETVLWAHYEGATGYGVAEVVVAWGKGDDEWTFGGAFRPTGRDSRDITFFTDNDGVAYIISATSMNSDLAIYQLTSDWHSVQDLAALVMINENREAPAVFYSDGLYYLFTSHTAGWLPSAGGVISSKSISGEWTELALPGNIATFGAQSGWISHYGSTVLMNANRWAANWPSKQVTTTIVLPVTVSNGFSSYNFYKTIEQDSLNNVALGVQSGRLTSIGAPSSSSGGADASAANDGASNNQSSYYAPSDVPFWFEVDLGKAAAIEQIDLTTRLIGGSETYYNFQVTASTDGKTYNTISDQSANKNMGFTSFLVDGKPSARYVRIAVENVTNVNTGASANWAAGIHEFSVYTQ